MKEDLINLKKLKRVKTSKNLENGQHRIVKKLHVLKWGFPRRPPADPIKTATNNF